MELKNIKLVDRLPAQEGESRNGKWKVQTCIFETDDKYPKNVAIQFWNSLAESFEKVDIGSILNIEFRVESREYNGKYYTDVTATKIISVEQITYGPAKTISSVPKQEPVTPNPAVTDGHEVVNDLPF